MKIGVGNEIKCDITGKNKYKPWMRQSRNIYFQIMNVSETFNFGTIYNGIKCVDTLYYGTSNSCKLYICICSHTSECEVFVECSRNGKTLSQ